MQEDINSEKLKMPQYYQKIIGYDRNDIRVSIPNAIDKDGNIIESDGKYQMVSVFIIESNFRVQEQTDTLQTMKMIQFKDRK